MRYANLRECDFSHSIFRLKYETGFRARRKIKKVFIPGNYDDSQRVFIDEIRKGGIISPLSPTHPKTL